MTTSPYNRTPMTATPLRARTGTSYQYRYTPSTGPERIDECFLRLCMGIMATSLISLATSFNSPGTLPCKAPCFMATKQYFPITTEQSGDSDQIEVEERRPANGLFRGFKVTGATSFKPPTQPALSRPKHPRPHWTKTAASLKRLHWAKIRARF